MKLIVYILIIIFIIPIQMILGDRIDILGIKPDIGLVIVYMIGFLYGEVDGLIMGILIGFVMDLLSPGLLGINLITKSLIGFTAGYLGRVILNPFINPGIMMILSFGSGLLTLLILQITTKRVVLSDAITRVILPQALYDSMIGFLIGIILTYRLDTVRYKGTPR